MVSMQKLWGLMLLYTIYHKINILL
jgi:hypothetical protein